MCIILFSENNLLLCLSDYVLSTYDINGVNFPLIETFPQTKGASLFALDNKVCKNWIFVIPWSCQPEYLSEFLIWSEISSLHTLCFQIIHSVLWEWLIPTQRGIPAVSV